MIRDPVGDRFKAIEAAWRAQLPSNTHLVVRVDGRAFHTWTRCSGCERPWDQRVADAMDTVTEALCSEIDGAVVGYTQSDEVSIIASDLGSQLASHWFGGVVPKIVSVSAGVATAAFNQAVVSELGKRPAVFDARVFPLATADDVRSYIGWRRADARRNAVSMLCDHHLGKKATLHVGTRDRIEMLAAKGVIVSEQPSGFVNGRLLHKVNRLEEVTYTHKRTGEQNTVEALRSHWEPVPATADCVADVLDELLPLAW